MGSWSQQSGFSSSDASTKDYPGLAAQARDTGRRTARGWNVRRRHSAERPPRTRCIKCWHAAAAAPERGESTSVQPAQRDGGEAGCAAAASGGAERCPQPERRCRERTDPLRGEGCAADGSRVMNRGCAPSGADPYPRLARASRGRISVGVRPYRGRRNGSTPKRCDDQAQQPAPYLRYAEEGEGYGSRGYGPFPLMFQASANAPAVEQRGRRQGRKGHKGT